MNDDTPFLGAESALANGCDWLDELHRPEDERDDRTEDILEQAVLFFDRALALLHERSHETFETGWQDFPDGGQPIMDERVIDADVAQIETELRELVRPALVLRGCNASVEQLAAITPDLITRVRGFLGERAAEHLQADRKYQDEMPCDC